MPASVWGWARVCGRGVSEWSRTRSRWLQWYIMGLALTGGRVATVGAGQEDADSDGSRQRYGTLGWINRARVSKCLMAGTGGRVGGCEGEMGWARV